MTGEELNKFCRELAETYGVPGYNDFQLKKLYSHVRFCTIAEAQKALDMMFLQEMKFPSIPQLLGYLKTVMADAKERRRQDAIKRFGSCECCQNTGAVVVVSRFDPLKREKSMRCGECQMAEVLGVLKEQPVYTHLGSRGVELVIVSLSMTATPNKRRLDEIQAMPKADREALLQQEPWLLWPLTLYGNKSIPLEPVHRKQTWEAQDWDDAGL